MVATNLLDGLGIPTRVRPSLRDILDLRYDVPMLATSTYHSATAAAEVMRREWQPFAKSP